MKTIRFASLLSRETRRQLWDLRDTLEKQEWAALQRRHQASHTVRFSRNGFRILGV